MRKVISGILRHNVIILFISFLLIAGGIYGYIKIPKEEMPKIEAIYGYVQITAPGLNSQEVKSDISDPVEDIINDYSNVKNYTATSVDNALIVLIEMDMADENSPETLEKIKTDVLAANLGDNVTDIKFGTDLRAGEAIYAVTGETLSEAELKAIAEDLAVEISKVQNIAKANVVSAYSQEVAVTINFTKLNDLTITVGDVYNVILANALRVPLGTADFNGGTSSILIDSYYGDISEIEALALYADPETGEVYTVGDIATVIIKDTENKKSFEFDSKPAAFVEVFFDEDVDFTSLGDELTDAVVGFGKTIPEGAEVTTMTFSPDYVDEQVSSVMINLLLCVAIVMLVVMVGLGLRNSLAIAFTIPVIVMTTIGLLYILGNHLQLISIAGLIVSIGILVDNSIVISEATQHELNSGKDMKEACTSAISQNFMPVLTSTLTTVAAFVPLMYLPGVAGNVAFSLPLTIIIAIGLSYIVAMTVTPTLAKYFFKPKKIRKKTTAKLNKSIKRTMKKVFSLGLAPTILAFLALGGLIYLAVQNLEIDILPKTEKSIVYIDYELLGSDSGEKTYDFAKEIEAVIKVQEDVKSVALSQGGDLPKFYMTLPVVNSLPDRGRFFVEYDIKSKDLSAKMEELDAGLDTLRERGPIVVKRLELSQPSAPVVVTLTSTNYKSLLKVSEEIFAEVQKLDSFKDGSLVAPGYKKDIELIPDRDKISGYGLTLAEVEQQTAFAMNALTQPLFREGENILDVSVKTGVASEESLMNLNIKTPAGQSVPLSELVRIKESQNLEYIKTYEGVPSVTIEGHMAEGYSTYNLERDIKKIVEDKTDNSVEAIYGGDNELTNELFSALTLSFIIALLVIYLIMYFQFKSLKQPMIILTTIPLSFIGALVAMLIFKENITLTAMLGMMSLVGIVVNNGILLVEYINRHHEEGHTIYQSCIKAVSRRLRPILLSSLTTIFGLIPLAVFGGDFFRPMAVTFMGGMITSTLLVLFIVPGLYYFTYKKRDKKIKEANVLNT